MYNCPTFFLFWKCLDDMAYWTHLYRTVADNELHFFHNFKLELYSFCEPCPYDNWDYIEISLSRISSVIRRIAMSLYVTDHNSRDIVHSKDIR